MHLCIDRSADGTRWQSLDGSEGRVILAAATATRTYRERMRFVVCLAVLVAAGCSSQKHVVHPSQLTQLDPQINGASFQDRNGFTFGIDPDEDIEVLLVDGRKLEGVVGDVRVSGGTFTWKHQVQMQITDVASVTVEKEDQSAGLGIGFAGIVLVPLVVLVYVLGGVTTQSGRPLRIRGRVSVAPVENVEGWASATAIDPALSTRAREALADAWLRDARDEHASVPAFAKISTSLVALGAPRELIEACHRAALDEIDHAQRTFTLASGYAGRTLGPAPLHALLGGDRDGRDPEVHLRKLAVETVEDGCLGEGVAAALAREGLAHATDARVRDTLAVIARDEAAHAELAWRILDWCCTTGGADLRDAVRAKLHELPRTIVPARVDARIAGELRRHGQVLAERRREIFVETRQDVVARATAILDAFTPSSRPSETGDSRAAAFR
jgi:hypothetical protein